MLTFKEKVACKEINQTQDPIPFAFSGCTDCRLVAFFDPGAAKGLHCGNETSSPKRPISLLNNSRRQLLLIRGVTLLSKIALQCNNIFIQATNKEGDGS